MKNQSDPFMRRWVKFDGVNTYELIILESHAPNQDYFVSYRLSDQSFSSDMCHAVSNVTIECSSGIGNVTLTRDDVNHAIILSKPSGQVTYYDANYLPKLAAVLGVWKGFLDASHYAYAGEYVIKIMQGNISNEFLVLHESRLLNGGHCSGGLPSVYQLTINPDNTWLFSHYTGLRYEYFQFDPIKMQITKAPNQEGFYLDCLQVYGDHGKALIFTKE